MLLGRHITKKVYKHPVLLNLTEEKWRYYVRQGNKIYPLQLIVCSTMILCSIVCFILCFVYKTKWWMFGGFAFSNIVERNVPDIYKNEIFVI